MRMHEIEGTFPILAFWHNVPGKEMIDQRVYFNAMNGKKIAYPTKLIHHCPNFL